MRTFLFGLPLLAVPVLAQDVPEPLRIHDDAHGVFDNDLLSPEFHRQRRNALREHLPKGGVAVFFANPVRNRSNDVDFEYHQDPDFYYLTGLREPDALLVVFKEPHELNGGRASEVLIVRDRDPKREVWEGHRFGPEVAKEMLGVEAVIGSKAYMDLEPFWDKSDKFFIADHEAGLANDPHSMVDLADLMDRTVKGIPTGAVDEKGELGKWMAGLREVKMEEELTLMRRAIEITCEAQKELMRKLEPNMTEYQTEAIVEYVFKANGAEHEGFPSIQGGGPHSCVLHYVTNRRTLTKGDLLVSDIGAEYHGYTADVTRTLPANGKFTPDQRKIYELVLAAQNAGITKVRAGMPFRGAHEAASEVIAKGLKDLGIIQETAEMKRYFMHGTSHYLGLDVHDAGTYEDLKKGNVITVEPGIYIAKDSPCDPRWWEIGVRIEDDILVTEGDPVNLSGCAPRTVEEVEALMAE